MNSKVCLAVIIILVVIVLVLSILCFYLTILTNIVKSEISEILKYRRGNHGIIKTGVIANADQEANLQAYHLSSRIVSGENRGGGINFNDGQEIVHEYHDDKAPAAKKHGRVKGRERVTTLDAETGRGGTSRRSDYWVSQQEEPVMTSVVTQDRVKHTSSGSAAVVGEGVGTVQDTGMSRMEKKDQESEFRGKTRTAGEAAGEAADRSRRTNSTKRRSSKRETALLSAPASGGGMQTEPSKRRHSHRRTSSREQRNSHEQQVEESQDVPITSHTSKQQSVAETAGNAYSTMSSEQRARDNHLATRYITTGSTGTTQKSTMGWTDNLQSEFASSSRNTQEANAGNITVTTTPETRNQHVTRNEMDIMAAVRALHTQPQEDRRVDVGYARVKQARREILVEHVTNEETSDSLPDPQEFVTDISGFIGRQSLSQFYQTQGTYIQRLAEQAATLTAEATSRNEGGMTNANLKQYYSDVSKTALYTNVVLIDDSGSMKKHDPERIPLLKKAMERIISIATTFDTEGVHVRFLNYPLRNSQVNLDGIQDLNHMRQIWDDVEWKGGTEIGKMLSDKVIKPFVLEKAMKGELRKPVLVSIITDGQPEAGYEKRELLSEVIFDCKQQLRNTRYGEKAVAFHITQIGSSQDASTYLDELAQDENVKSMIYCTTEHLDEQIRLYDVGDVVGAYNFWWVNELLVAIDP